MCENVQLLWAMCRIGIYSLCRRMHCVADFAEKPEFSVLCVGLSKAGKSSLLCLMSGEEYDSIEPTVGFSIKALMMEDCVLNVKELGGGDNVRPYWDRYYQGIEAVIFVISSSCSQDDLEINKSEFQKVISQSSFRLLPLLVLISQTEKEGARSQEEISQFLEIPSSTSKRQVIVQSCKTNELPHLKESFVKLSKELLKTNETVDSSKDGEFSRI